MQEKHKNIIINPLPYWYKHSCYVHQRSTDRGFNILKKNNMSQRILKINCNEGFTSVILSESDGFVQLTVNDKESVFLDKVELQYLINEIEILKNLIQ